MDSEDTARYPKLLTNYISTLLLKSISPKRLLPRASAHFTHCSWSSLSPNPGTVIVKRCLKHLKRIVFLALWPKGIPQGLMKWELFSPGWPAWPLSLENKAVIFTPGKDDWVFSLSPRLNFIKLYTCITSCLWDCELLQGIYEAITTEAKYRLVLLQLTDHNADGWRCLEIQLPTSILS